MRVAVTGHRDLDAPTTALIDAEIRVLLARSPQDIVGVSCLAAGADQIFARAVLDLGGRLEVVIPAAGYAAVLDTPAKQGFEELKGRASRIWMLAHRRPGPVSYLDASLKMLDHVDSLIAVWDGRAARGLGGTAEIVEHARRRDVAVYIVWPKGAVHGT